MQNEWHIKMPYTNRDVVIEMADTDLSVEIKDERYTVVVARYRMAATGDRFYTLSSAVEAQGLAYRLLYIFYDADGHELAKGYFMEERRAVSPAGTASVDVEVLITSEGRGSLSLKDMQLCDAGEYQSRMARIVALSSFVTKEPGAVWHRSYEESVRDTLASAFTSREATLITAPGMEVLLDSGEGKGYAVADIDFNDPARRRWLSCNSYGAPYEYYMCERREDLYTGIPERVL